MTYYDNKDKLAINKTISSIMNAEEVKYTEKDMEASYDKGFKDATTTWINVEDKLPYKDGKSSIFVLVYNTYNEIIVRPYNEYHNCWDDEDADDYYCDAVGQSVTHWMPLPKSPK